MNRSKTVELMARAHDAEDAAQRGEPSPWEHFDCDGSCPECETFKGDRISAMEAALQAIELAGFVVVPREPTSEMIKAGHETNWLYNNGAVGPLYTAMVSTFLLDQGQGDQGSSRDHDPSTTVATPKSAAPEGVPCRLCFGSRRLRCIDRDETVACPACNPSPAKE